MKSFKNIFKTVQKTVKDLERYVEHTDTLIDANEQLMVEIQSEVYTLRSNRAKALETRNRLATLSGFNE